MSETLTCICNEGFGMNLSCPVHSNPPPTGVPSGPSAADVRRRAAIEAAQNLVVAADIVGENPQIEQLVDAIMAALASRAPAGEPTRDGPYGVRSCRGHFHITVGDNDVMNRFGDALDEQAAREGAATLNAEHFVSIEALQAEIAMLRAAGAAPDGKKPSEEAAEAYWRHCLGPEYADLPRDDKQIGHIRRHLAAAYAVDFGVKP